MQPLLLYQLKILVKASHKRYCSYSPRFREENRYQSCDKSEFTDT